MAEAAPRGVGPAAGAEGYSEHWFHAEDGLRLYYRDYGDPLSAATPLVCLCGLTRNARDYHPMALHQAGRRRVVCPDYRGRGRSAYDPEAANYTPQVYLRDLGHLLAAANLGKVALCGTSLGGLLAMGFAVASPLSLAGVILNDVGPEIDPEGLNRIRRYVGQPIHPKGWDEAVATLKSIYPDMGLETEAAWLDFARDTFREEPDGGLALDYDLALAGRLDGPVPDLWRLFRALRPIPTLALRGERSTVLAEATFARMAEEKPDLIQATVPRVGHAPRLTETTSREAIDGFLEQLDRSGN